MGTPFGCEILGLGVRLLLSEDPSRVVVALDFRNAHNEFDRTLAIKAYMSKVVHGRRVLEGEEDSFGNAAVSIGKLLTVFGLPKAKLWGSTRTEDFMEVCEGEDGGAQGAPTTSAAFVVLLDDVLKEFDQRDDVVAVRAYQDDVCLVLPRGNIAPVIEEIQQRFEEKCGFVMNTGKCAYFSPQGPLDDDLKPLWLKEGIDSTNGRGVTIVGIPIGDDDYVTSAVQEVANRVIRQIESVSAKLSSISHESFMALKHSLQKRFSYVLQTLPPRFTMVQALYNYIF